MAVSLISSNDINITQTGSDITLDLTSNAVANKNIYSTSETRIGTWINSKPLYRKVIDYTITTGVNSWHEIETLNNIATLCIKGVFVIRGTEYYLNPYQGYNFYYSTSTSKLNEQHTSAYWEGYHMYLIVEYTKTTD